MDMKKFTANMATSTRRYVEYKLIVIKCNGKKIGYINNGMFVANDLFASEFYPDGYTLTDLNDLSKAVELGIAKAALLN